mgnify:CR=1 FL=1
MEILFIYALAVFRVSYMLVEDIGPYDVFKRLRKATKRFKWVNLECIYCISVPLSLLLLLFGLTLIECLAVASLVLFINLAHERLL